MLIRNPFDIRRRKLISQVRRMRKNFFQTTVRIKLQDEGMHCANGWLKRLDTVDLLSVLCLISNPMCETGFLLL